MTDGKWTDWDEATAFMEFPWRIQGVEDPGTYIKNRQPIRDCMPTRQKQPSLLITALQHSTKAQAAHHISI